MSIIQFLIISLTIISSLSISTSTSVVSSCSACHQFSTCIQTSVPNNNAPICKCKKRKSVSYACKCRDGYVSLYNLC